MSIKLTDEQVGVKDGWRLRVSGEIRRANEDEVWKNGIGPWMPVDISAGEIMSALSYPVRTKDPMIVTEAFPDLGAKDTKGKLRYSLLTPKALKAIIAVREYGGIKYKDPTNYAKVPPMDFWEAGVRHLFKMHEGEEIDPESGLPHSHHALCSLMLMVENEI